ncbi:MAG: DUF1460 domain-containing protein [Muribaculaceae bacterium]|nr:DUF1460 domain-containing protein [Muribaculaceae bacterium]
MKKIILCLAIVASSCHTGTTQRAEAAPQQQMRFHCANDTTEIVELLKKGYESGLETPNELVSFYGHQLLGRPYVAHTLEGESEMLTINIDELDCTTFVETLYALARTTLNGRYSWRDYANNLENVRYRGGKMDGYASRLHYISDWSIDNGSRGNLHEVTADIQGVQYKIKNINYMSTHRDAYAALKDSVTFERVRNNEVGFRNHRFPYIRKEILGSKKVKEAVKSGDFVGLVTKMEGLDISHMGIIEKDEKGEIYLLDASMRGEQVQLEKVNMQQMLRNSKNNIGIRVWRMKP